MATHPTVNLPWRDFPGNPGVKNLPANAGFGPWSEN